MHPQFPVHEEQVFVEHPLLMDSAAGIPKKTVRLEEIIEFRIFRKKLKFLRRSKNENHDF